MMMILMIDDDDDETDDADVAAASNNDNVEAKSRKHITQFLIPNLYKHPTSKERKKRNREKMNIKIHKL